MPFDPENSINQLCARGMQLEGEGRPEEATKLFCQAWDEATNELEKLTAAHYVARHQNSTAEKLKWDKTALEFACQIHSPEIKSLYPSLYLNIAKDLEDLGEFPEAMEHYLLALSYVMYLPKDGYGRMIIAGINKGIERVKTTDSK